MGTISISIDTEPDLYSGNYDGIIKGFPLLAPLLKKYHIPATFFVTADVLKKYPSVFKELNKQGHEIALHGYTHERFDNIPYNEKEKRIKKSISVYYQIFQKYPEGFRAPQHSIDNETLEILAKEGIKYDSSLTPWNFYHIIFFWKIKINFAHNFKRMIPHQIKNISEIPSSSFFLPFSSITIRVLPRPLLKLYLYFISRFKISVFLMHSWDLIDIPKSKLSRLTPSKKFLSKLEYSLDYLSKKGKFLPIKQLIPPVQA